MLERSLGYSTVAEDLFDRFICFHLQSILSFFIIVDLNLMDSLIKILIYLLIFLVLFIQLFTQVLNHFILHYVLLLVLKYLTGVRLLSR